MCHTYGKTKFFFLNIYLSFHRVCVKHIVFLCWHMRFLCAFHIIYMSHVFMLKILRLNLHSAYLLYQNTPFIVYVCIRDAKYLVLSFHSHPLCPPPHRLTTCREPHLSKKSIPFVLLSQILYSRGNTIYIYNTSTLIQNTFIPNSGYGSRSYVVYISKILFKIIYDN